MDQQQLRDGARHFMERFYSYPSIFRRSLQAGNNSIAQLWGFWGMNQAYRSYFESWTRRMTDRSSPWQVPDAEEQGFPWVGGAMPWYYPLSDKTGRVLTWGHHLWDKAARPAGTASTALILAGSVLASLLVLGGAQLLAAFRWPVPWPGTVLGLAAFSAAAWGSTYLVDRVTRTQARGGAALAGLTAAMVPITAGMLLLPEHARSWRFLCAVSILCFALKAWNLTQTRSDEGSMKAASFLLLWPGFDFSTAFVPDRTRELLVRHYPIMGLGWLRLTLAALVFPALFLLSLQGEQGAWLLLGLLGRGLLAYLVLRGTLEWLTGYWRMAGCEVPDPFGRHPFGPSPTALWRSWNIPYRQWLLRHVYVPLGGRARPVLATMGTFLFSGVVGAMAMAPVIGRLPWEPILFFLAQGALVVLEKRLLARGITSRRLVATGMAATFLVLGPWLFAVTDRIFV